MIIFIAFLAISTPSFECLRTRTVQGALFIGFFHLQLFEESTMIIFIVSNMKKLRLGELKTLALTCTDLDPFELAPSLVFLCYVILHWVVGEKRRIGSTLRSLCHSLSLLVWNHPLARPLSSSALLPTHSLLKLTAVITSKPTCICVSVLILRDLPLIK